MATPDDVSQASPTASTPEQMRALTHPLRLQILELMGDEGDLTATRCAELTGESVASCSYHLRQLAKYGFVERVDTASGKERPWRAVRHFSVRPDLEVPGALPAAQAFGDLWVTRVFDRIRDWMAHVDGDDPEWLLASTQTSSRVWATREELDELSRGLEKLTEHLQGRWEDPAKRPPGSRPVNLFASAWADIES
ncbi:winged helix-turn-helix domain-containing protein [Nocardioides limicola]|uniref:winged helix-turn-helix domain-containing protein n=1 Tax=Nocardioides limicola TaxID=2803368 RepID=UPI00193BFBE4|nr:winged helix-turn-helix domain-containing protein [Nocardioides sp. DJM-14]